MNIDRKLVRKVIESFVDSPEYYWNNNARQLKKSSSRIKRLFDYYGWDAESLIEIIICIAEERISKNTKTIYFSSFGSSGSHLLQHVLVDSFDMIGLGEIYLPQPLENTLREVDLKSGQMLLECYHLLHSPPENIFKNKPIINTAHRASLQTFSSSTALFTPVFIIRDPVELTISRSFRKDEYRSYLGMADVSDEEYLKENIEKTKRFYQSALKYPYEYYLFFEDISKNPVRVAELLSLISNEKGNESKVLESLKRAVETGATNKYSGPKILVSESLISLAESELKNISSKVEEFRSVYAGKKAL
ncbi:hypothetical protein [Halomonas sp. MS1]|nr:hypothetical protein [Halomonas sp. MS1]UTD55536.1 hypothetical protein NF683_20740 [Halomonas sp. MS1]